MEHSLPLQNTSIVVTRPSHQSETICLQLAQLGANAITFPCIDIQANPALNPQQLGEQLSTGDIVIFVSPNAVMQTAAQLPTFADCLPHDCTVFALGTATANALYQQGIQQVVTPENTSDSEALLELDPLQAIGQKVIFIIKGSGGRELLYDTLQARGARVTSLHVYQRGVPSVVNTTPLHNKIDLILFTSQEMVTNFLTLIPDSLQESLLNSQTLVGHTRIAEKVTSLGFKKLPIIAATPTDADMLTAIQQWAQ